MFNASCLELPSVLIKYGFLNDLKNFRNHPVGHLLSKTIELHDKSKFNLHGFYFGKKQKKDDIYYLRFKKAFDKFHDIANMSTEEIVNLSRNLKIDIANKYNLKIIYCIGEKLNEIKIRKKIQSEDLQKYLDIKKNTVFLQKSKNKLVNEFIFDSFRKKLKPSVRNFVRGNTQ